MLTFGICSTKRVHSQLKDYFSVLAMNPYLGGISGVASFITTDEQL